MRCCTLIRHGQHYRSDIFCEGLRKHGYQIETRWQRLPDRRDILLLWNRNRSLDPIAQIYERAGARVLIAENGYLPTLAGGGPKYYALALSSHNGAGRWFVGDAPRFQISDQPWRKRGSKVLILPQRGIGQPGVAMPGNWPQMALRRLRDMTDRELILRPHPGHQRQSAQLEFDDIWCAITWGSGAAIKALQAGIPVFHDFPEWIGSAASARLARSIENCQTGSRDLLWTRLSWAQWTLDEIASGEALDRLLNEEDRGLFRAGQPPQPADRSGHDGRHCQDRRRGWGAAIEPTAPAGPS